MLHRFATYEEAAIFVSMKRSEGYFADILHEHVSVLWGPLAVGGVAAWVSEEAAEEGEDVPDLGVKLPYLPQELSMLLGYMVLAVPAILLAIAVFGWLQSMALYPLELGLVLLIVLVKLALGFALWSVTACFASAWVHAFWDPSHRLHRQALGAHIGFGLVGLITITPLGELLLSLLFTLWPM